jgi:hypothetical protein
MKMGYVGAPTPAALEKRSSEAREDHYMQCPKVAGLRNLTAASQCVFPLLSLDFFCVDHTLAQASVALLFSRKVYFPLHNPT